MHDRSSKETPELVEMHLQIAERFIQFMATPFIMNFYSYSFLIELF